MSFAVGSQEAAADKKGIMIPHSCLVGGANKIKAEIVTRSQNKSSGVLLIRPKPRVRKKQYPKENWPAGWRNRRSLRRTTMRPGRN